MNVSVVLQDTGLLEQNKFYFDTGVQTAKKQATTKQSNLLCIQCTLIKLTNVRVNVAWEKASLRVMTTKV